MRASAAPALLALVAAPAWSAARFEVSGKVGTRGEEVELRVELVNRGDAAAVPLQVDAGFLGGRATARVEDGVAPGASREVVLHFPLEPERPGVHMADLHLQFPVSPGAPAQGSSSQRAYLLVSLGSNPPPAVALAVPAVSLDTRATLRVGVRSADGKAHRVRLRVLPPRGLNTLAGGVREVDVPAAGEASADVELLRAGAPRGSRTGFLVVASALDGPEERTTVATGEAEVRPAPPPLTARLRWPLVVLGAALLLAALAYEVGVGRRRHG